MKNICFQMTRKAWLTIVMVLCLAFPALAQKTTVTGTVVDPEGEPLIGASVIAEGTAAGVATDFDGNFRIDVAPNAVLVVSYVGFDTQRINVAGRDHIDVVLKENTVMLSEVVAIGYGTVKKSDATGSVAVVKPDEIAAGLATSAQDLLVGATPGVVVTTTGNPSEGGTIRIRGGASLNASNDPLIVIDGVPMDGNTVTGSSNPLSLVSPENIESMTVLKDASATAIFGSRASNGVIIITTKKGQKGRPQVNFAANVYVNTPRNYLNMMDAASFRNFMVNEYGEDSPLLDGLGSADTNWQKEILTTTVSSDYNLSVGGTVGFLPYRVAVNYTNNKGIIRETGMDRVTASINLTPTFFNGHLSVSANVKGAYVENNYQGDGKLGSAIGMNPTLPIYQPGGNIFLNYTTFTKAGTFADETTPGYQISDLYTKNPVAQLREGCGKGRAWQSVGNIQFDLKIPYFEDLRANLNLGYDYSHGKYNGHSNPFSPMNWDSTHYVPNPADPTGFNADVDGQIRDGYNSESHQFATNYTLLLDFYLNYNKTVDAIKSSFDVTAGYSWQRFKWKSHNYNTMWAPIETAEYLVQAYELGGINVPYTYDLSNIEGAREYLTALNGWQSHPTEYSSTPHQLVSFFGRFNYWFDDRYGVTATVRRDGTSRFSPETRWGTFPSVALSWRVIGESFMEPTRGWLSDLKLRATWGVTGQQNIGGDYFPYLPTFSNWTSTSETYINPVTGEISPDNKLTTVNAYNAALKWEETTTWNIGLDFGFFNNRLMGSLELYKRKTKDLITWAPYPAGSNLTNKGNINLGDLENTGIEFNLTARPIVNQTFQWTSTFNIGANKNKITRLAEGASGMAGPSIGTAGQVQKHEVGYAAFSYYVYEQVYKADGTPMEGVVVDRNGDGQITDDDRYLYHSRDPKVTMTWGNTFNYKNWDLGFSLRASIGNWVYNKNECDNAFKKPGTNTLPLFNLMDDVYLWNSTKSTPIQYSDYWVQNASFVRCDNITLGYTWDNLLHNALRLRLYGAVQNPFVITNYRGLDPEVFSGIDSSVYPKPITFSVGVVATF